MKLAFEAPVADLTFEPAPMAARPYWAQPPLVVATNGRAEHGVAVRLDSALRLLGVTFVYSRDENGVTRLFTRTLDRTGSAPRKRVAGR